MENRLCIFDYHGTLMWALDAHEAAYSGTVRDLFGVRGSIHDVSFVASTIQDVTIAIAQANGVDPKNAESKRPLILPVYEKLFREALESDAPARVLPGVPEFLHSLEEQQIPIALYTGESFNSVDAVLESGQISRYFPRNVRACASDENPDRTELLRLCVQKAKAEYKTDFPNRQIFVFDDSVRGLQAGRELGLVTVGVATGPQDYSLLEREKLDHLFKDLSEWRKILEIVSNYSPKEC